MSLDKKRVALISLFASICLAIGKFTIALATGSLGILSDAVHSLLDVGATGITYMAVRVSDRPADREHHFGHAKIESVTALIETGLLFVTCGWIVWEAVGRLFFKESHVEVTWWAVALICVSILIDYNRAHALKRTAEATGSEALAADALHFFSDMWSSGAVLVGLGASWLGFPAGDALAALAVAAVIGLAGYRLGRRTIDTLTDTAPEGVADQVAAVAERGEGILSLKRARIRPAGATTFVDADITVRRTLPFDKVDRIKADFVAAVREEVGDADVSVTAHPVALDDETVHDKVMLVANRRGAAVHHVTVQHVGEKLSVSLDIEVDEAMPYWEAHDIADGLEKAIGKELGEDVEVESHIEPAHLTGVDGIDEKPELRDEIAGLLSELAARQTLLSNVHDVRVRRNAHGLFVTFHCWVDRDLPVVTVHEAVDEMERAFRERMPDVRRVIAHAEPHGA